MNTIESLNERDFETSINGKQTCLILLKNENGMSVALTNYGARIVSIFVPDKFGKFDDVVLGFNTIQEYLSADELYHGATIGRFANRIANARFTLDDEEIQLTANNGINHLHGGTNGFHAVVWDVLESDGHSVTFRYNSKDGEEGFPGNLIVDVSFTLTQENELVIEYLAISDKKTILNLTNHAYFNLKAEGSGSVGQHKLTIFADAFTPINERGIPTGEIQSVEHTPLDFRKEKDMGEEWNADHTQIQIGNGYDHNFVLKKRESNTFEFVAKVYEPESGRVLEVHTTEPGLQLYTANYFSGNDIGKQGTSYLPKSAFCLETQHFPDSPNQSHFPNVVLEKGEKFYSKTVYGFKKTG